MRIGMARRGCAAIAVTALVAAAWGGLTAASAAANGASGMFGKLGRWAPVGHGRTIPGPWDWGWRVGGSPPTPTLNGDWAPFNRCPVDNPAMLAADGVNDTAICFAVHSPSGALKIGGLALPTGESDTQFGVVVENQEGAESLYRAISPQGGATVMTPIDIPNGLPALVCAAPPWDLRWFCEHAGHLSSRVTDIAATVEQAGELSNFDFIGDIEIGVPIITEPVRVHLQNPLLGPSCYIGSQSEPIVLQTENFTAFTSSEFDHAEGNGTSVGENAGAMELLATFGATTGDQSFAVPGVNGCGFRGMLDGTIDQGAGLPSPAGANGLLLNETAGYLTGLGEPSAIAPNDGKVLAQDWHSAIVGGPHGHWGH